MNHTTLRRLAGLSESVNTNLELINQLKELMAHHAAKPLVDDEYIKDMTPAAAANYRAGWQACASWVLDIINDHR